VKVGDLARHTYFGYVGIIVKRVQSDKWTILRNGILRNWWIENIELINESR